MILIVSGGQLIVKGGSTKLIKYQFLPHTQGGRLTHTKNIFLLIRTVSREILRLQQFQNSDTETSTTTEYKYALHIYLPKYCILIQENSLLAVRDIYPPTNFLSYVFTLFIRLLLNAEEFLFRVSNCEPLIETNPIAISSPFLSFRPPLPLYPMSVLLSLPVQFLKASRLNQTRSNLLSLCLNFG